MPLRVEQLDEPRAIQEEIDRARAEISRSVLTLRERVDEATDWRAWVRRRPLLLVAGALAVGFWLGWRRSKK
ncbi:MAG: hypothetical protein ACOX6T_20310 [Myxococcales bacterium]|jgi:hypothetical protein